MRVLFSVSNWPSHYASMIPLGWALTAAGHEVRVLCTPAQRDTVRNAGLLPVPVLADMDLIFQARLANVLAAGAGGWPYPVPPLHPDTGAVLDDVAGFDIGALMRDRIPRIRAERQASADAAVEFARGWRPDLVVHDPAVIEGLLVARVLDVPAVLHLWGPVGTHEAEADITPRDHSAAFARYGVGEMSFDLVEQVIDVCPAELAPALKAPAIDCRYLPYYAGLGDALAPPRTGRRVCLVWGNSAAATFGPDVFAGPRMLAALAARDVDVELVANARDVASLGELPARVTPRSEIPLHLLLPGCEMVLHGGTAGCAMTALAAGVPQVAVPHGFDQPLISRRVEAAGAGIAVPNQDATVERLGAAIDEVLADPGHRERAGRLAETMARRPAPSELVPTLVSLAGG